MKIKRPDSIEKYKELVNDKIHEMSVFPFRKCQTHEDCHLDDFYPGKIWRKMEKEKKHESIKT